MHGIQARRAEIDTAIPARWMIPPVTSHRFPGDERWLGQFTPRDIPLVVASQTSDFSILFFLVTTGSHLQRDGALIDPLLSWYRIRVLGLHGKEWHIDPLVEQAQDWRLWIWEGHTLVEVEWDPGEWWWPPLDLSESPVPFFFLQHAHWHECAWGSAT